MKLDSAFHIAKPYMLLDDNEVKEFVELFSPTPPPKRRKVFKKATDLFRLTNVYFNQDRTLAVTAISTHCGLLCGRMDWKVFWKSKKASGKKGHGSLVTRCLSR